MRVPKWRENHHDFSGSAAGGCVGQELVGRDTSFCLVPGPLIKRIDPGPDPLSNKFNEFGPVDLVRKPELDTLADFKKVLPETSIESGLLWITNHPKSLAGLWPRRVGCEYVEMEPRGTPFRSTEQAKVDGDIGIGVRMKAEDYYALPVAKNPKEFAEIEQRMKNESSIQQESKDGR